MEEDKVNIDIINKKRKVAISSLIGAIVIVSIKVAATILSGSLAVLSELVHSSSDLIASIVTIISIGISSKPPDEKHHYGHEKAESFSALVQVLILIAMCVYVLYEAFERIMKPPTGINIDIFTFGAIVICIFIDFSRARALKKVARETGSQALEADALHFSSDIMSSIVVLAGMGLFYIHPIFDPIAAIIVSFIIIGTTIDLTKRAMDTLMDRTPAGMWNDVKKTVMDSKGIEEIKNLRIRETGSRIFVDMVVGIGRTKFFREVFLIKEEVIKRVKSVIGNNGDVVVHSVPVETSDETINDKVKLIVGEEGFKCHDVYSHLIGNEIFTELHVEVGGTNDLERAHSIVTALETRIRTELNIGHIKVHIDEESDGVFLSEDVTETSKDIIYELDKLIKKEKIVLHYHDLKIVKSGEKLRISLNCEFKEDAELDIVHGAVEALEGKLLFGLRHRFPLVFNVIIHAEPFGHN